MNGLSEVLTLASFDALRGKSAVITGSTSGIGLGIAQAFASAGVNVALNGFGDAEEIETNRAEIEAAGVKALYNGADMTKPDEIKGLIQEAEETFGAVDILVNNAGIQHVEPVEDFPDGKWEAILAINLSSSFYTIKAAMPGMKQRGYGRIINIASAHGLTASPYKAAYVSAKHGVVGLTKPVALEVAEENITANAICPGYVKTPMVEGQIADQAKAYNMTEEEVVREVSLERQPNKRFIDVDELAALALFLATPAGRSMTGRAITVDGGWTAR
ncbi:MAG: 3-hydroxybutyrate dehydrogenase [Sphingomonadales bacterium]